MFKFGKASLASRKKLHPKLQLLVDEAIKVIDFKILDSTRGRADQTRAFLTGKSKARFGQSAHNYVPAIAMDLFPAPYEWEGTDAMKAFKALGETLGQYNPDRPNDPNNRGLALKLKIGLRWGGDWNMDGTKTTSDNWDKPHFELHPWRDWAKSSKLYED